MYTIELRHNGELVARQDLPDWGSVIAAVEVLDGLIPAPVPESCAAGAVALYNNKATGHGLLVIEHEELLCATGS